MVPRRIIPDIFPQEPLHPRDLALPKILVTKVREDPLAVRPSVIVLRVRLESARDELELALRRREHGLRGWVDVDSRCDSSSCARLELALQRGEEEPAVVPHLIVL